jgi:hypothetical protein
MNLENSVIPGDLGIVLSRIEARQIIILERLDKIMSEVDDALAGILETMKNTDGKMDSMILLYNGLKEQLLNIGKLTDEQKAKVAEIMDEAAKQAAEIDAAAEATPTT